jgi:hypothetical protein
LLHFKKCSPNRYNRWYLNHRWKIDPIAKFASIARRTLRRFFNSERGKEWEADLWAMCALVYFRKFVNPLDLTRFLERHPRKMSILLLAAYSALYCGTKERILTPFKALSRWKRGLSALRCDLASPPPFRRKRPPPRWRARSVALKFHPASSQTSTQTA